MKLEQTNIDISIIIPVYNSPNGIQSTLNALITQDYPKDKYEIIVVDNASTDRTPQIVKEFSKDYVGLIHLYFQKEIQGSYAARNVGIKYARGKVVAFVDADMWMGSTWLSMVMKYMNTTKSVYMGCQVIVCSDQQTLVSLCNQVTGFPVEDYINKYHFAPTCCLVVKKDLFAELGMFDSNLVSGGDCEFGNRVHSFGIPLKYGQGIVLYHPARNFLWPFAKKYFRTGIGIAQLILFYPGRFEHLRRTKLRAFAPPNIFQLQKKLNACISTRTITISWWERVGIFVIAWFAKYVQIIGYLYGRYL